jgi:hypothetical protein
VAQIVEAHVWQIRSREQIFELLQQIALIEGRAPLRRKDQSMILLQLTSHTSLLCLALGMTGQRALDKDWHWQQASTALCLWRL